MNMESFLLGNASGKKMLPKCLCVMVFIVVMAISDSRVLCNTSRTELVRGMNHEKHYLR